MKTPFKLKQKCRDCGRRAWISRGVIEWRNSINHKPERKTA